MSDLVDDAVSAIQKLPRARREELARLVLRLANQDDDPEPIDPDHLPAVLEALAQAERREFASPAELEATFRRFDR